MQRFASYCCVAVLVLANGVGMSIAVAGEYTYSMAATEASGSSYSPALGDSSASASGGAGRVEGMSSRYLVSQDDVPETATQRLDDADVVTSPPPTVPAGGSSGASDKRASHRWQSLVPGAIK